MTALIASAPASWADRAISEISVTFGVSLIINNFLVNCLNWRVRLDTISVLTPNSIPPCLTLGHDMLI